MYELIPGKEVYGSTEQSSRIDINLFIYETIDSWIRLRVKQILRGDESNRTDGKEAAPYARFIDHKQLLRELKELFDEIIEYFSKNHCDIMKGKVQSHLQYLHNWEKDKKMAGIK